MNKNLLALFVAVSLMSLLASVSALVPQDCSVSASIINQDPYPATPGESVKVVFKVEGISQEACGDLVFSVVEGFPFTLEPDQEASRRLTSGTHVDEFSSYWLVPYRLIVNENALDGESEIETRLTRSGGTQSVSLINKFNITIEDTSADFEITVKDYVASTKTLTFEILNTGENNAEALTIEVPKQDTINIKGSNRNIIGSLDANDDTTFSYEATPQEGDIKMIVLYTDELGTRKTMEKIVHFDPSYFNDRVRDQKQTPITMYVVVGIIVLLVIWFIWSRFKRRKKAKF